MPKLYSIFFILFTGFLLCHQENWKDVVIKLFDIISLAVSEYFVVFCKLFNISFEGVLFIIDNLVSEYFETFQICFNHTLDVLENMVDNYLNLLKFLIQNLVGVPNSWVYTFGAVSITYIIKKF